MIGMSTTLVAHQFGLDFKLIKNSKFGTFSERAANPNIVSEKEDIFHYGVALHSQCGATGSSGMGELKG